MPARMVRRPWMMPSVGETMRSISTPNGSMPSAARSRRAAASPWNLSKSPISASRTRFSICNARSFTVFTSGRMFTGIEMSNRSSTCSSRFMTCSESRSRSPSRSVSSPISTRPCVSVASSVLSSARICGYSSMIFPVMSCLRFLPAVGPGEPRLEADGRPPAGGEREGVTIAQPVRMRDLAHLARRQHRGIAEEAGGPEIGRCRKAEQRHGNRHAAHRPPRAQRATGNGSAPCPSRILRDVRHRARMSGRNRCRPRASAAPPSRDRRRR